MGIPSTNYGLIFLQEMCLFCFDVLHAQLNNYDPPPDPHSSHPSLNGLSNGGPLSHHNHRSYHHDSHHHGHPLVRKSDGKRKNDDFLRLKFFYPKRILACFSVFSVGWVPKWPLPSLCDVEHWEGKATARLHWHILTDEPSRWTQGICAYQVDRLDQNVSLISMFWLMLSNILTW